MSIFFLFNLVLGASLLNVNASSSSIIDFYLFYFVLILFLYELALIWILMHRCKVMIQSAKSDENDDGKPQSRPRKTISGTISSIWEREGISGFFKGLEAQMLKTVLTSALLLMIKEKITKSTWVAMIALRRFMLTRPQLKRS